MTWELYYRHCGFAGDAPGDWVGPLAGTIAVGNPANSDEHLITVFPDIDMTGRLESAMLCWQIRRQGATDADTGIARLLEFDIHYYAIKCGTPSHIPQAA